MKDVLIRLGIWSLAYALAVIYAYVFDMTKGEGGIAFLAWGFYLNNLRDNPQ